MGEIVVERVIAVNACSAMVKSTVFFSEVQFDISRVLASLQEGRNSSTLLSN